MRSTVPRCIRDRRTRRRPGHSPGEGAGFADDSEDDITARVQTQEHAIYPLVIGWFAQGRLKMRDNAAWLDGRRLPPQGYASDE